MLRTFKILTALAAGLTLAASVHGFSVWGPLETWQTAALSYGTRYWYSINAESNVPPIIIGNGGAVTELGGTKNFGEGSRLNTAVMTYAFDYSFVSYFGAEGIKAVNAAFAVLNALPKVSAASPNLTEFITDGNQQINYTAQALSMLDIKSTVLQIMLEHMGLLGETHVFDLGGQTLIGPACTSEYFVLERNYDPITYNPTPYVNGALYSYTIFDGCASGNAIADAMETRNDLTDFNSFTAVATYEGLRLGAFYLGLTRDDFGGLRYLYKKNNYNFEALAPNTYVGSLTSTWSPVTTNALATGWEGVLGGAEKINFVNINYDSIYGTAWGTNVVTYTLPTVTNYQLSEITVVRSNTAPDIIFAAADLLVSPNDPTFTRTVTFIANPSTTQSGTTVAPGTFSPTSVIVFNNVGQLNFNYYPGFIDGSTPFLTPYFQWGVFGGGTNAPIIFPVGANLAALEEEVTTQPPGSVNQTWAGVISTNTTASGTGAGSTGGGAGGGAAGAAVPVGSGQ
jgi:hypothetical protein